jgi:hypothetical protein
MGLGLCYDTTAAASKTTTAAATRAAGAVANSLHGEVATKDLASRIIRRTL